MCRVLVSNQPNTDSAEKPTRRGRSTGAIAYVTVLYPATSHTFIHREVIGLRERGIAVSTFSLNGVDASSLLSEFERHEVANTLQIKTLPVTTLMRTIARSTLTHPIAAAKTLRLAVRGRGLDLDSRMKAVFQVAEAMVLHAACRRAGITHVHAHFGQAPANVAWFATEYAAAAGDGAWTFSFTIHGPQDCLAESDTTLRRKVEAATLVISVSDFTAAQLLRRIDPSLWDKVEVVRCGVDMTPAPLESASRPADDDQIILMVARISAEKGHVVAVQAISMLRSRGIEARLRLVGPGDIDEIVMPMARKFGVADLIDHVGPLEPKDVAEELGRATVFALPSFAEGLPIVIMEAMVNGCPVVASGISGVPELVEDGVTGVLVPPARADLLADALADLLTDDDLRHEMSAAARSRVAHLHDGERQINLLVDSFERAGVIEAPSERRPA